MTELPLCSSDPYDTSSGSLQLISIKPLAAQPNYSHPASSERSPDSVIVNGEVIHIYNTVTIHLERDLIDTNTDMSKQHPDILKAL